MSKISPDNRKYWPSLKSDEEAERFVAEADLTEYDWSKMKPVHFEFEQKNAVVNMRLPERQLAEIKRLAEERGIKYQRFMRELLSRGMQTLD